MLWRHFRWRIAVILVLVAGSMFAWWSYALTPLHRWYFWPYLNCSLQGDNPGSYSEIRWLYKTAPRRQQELATGQDVVSTLEKESDTFPVQLSAAARKAGWTGLMRGEEEWIDVPRLQPFLRQEFYGNQSLFRLLLTPLLWSIAAWLSVLAGEDWLRNRWFRTRQYRSAWEEPRAGLLARCAEAMRNLQFLTAKAMKILRGTRTSPTAQKSSENTAPERPYKPAETGLPLFGAAQQAPKDRLTSTAISRDRLM